VGQVVAGVEAAHGEALDQEAEEGGQADGAEESRAKLPVSRASQAVR
jgi:hypothetical protein